MKRQFFFTPEERDLLRTALEIWNYNLLKKNAYSDNAHHNAGRYTSRRINEMLKRLAEPE